MSEYGYKSRDDKGPRGGGRLRLRAGHGRGGRFRSRGRGRRGGRRVGTGGLGVGFRARGKCPAPRGEIAGRGARGRNPFFRRLQPGQLP